VIVNDKVICAVAAVMFFAGGYAVRGVLHKCPTADTKVVTQVEYRDKVKTEIAYVPKETVIYKAADGSTKSGLEKTDVDVKVNKPALNVKVNGKEFAVTKADDEQFLFDKNKLTMTQTSTANLNIHVPSVDETRRWGVGVGASKDGAVAALSFPLIGKLDGWAAGRRGDVMGGVMFRF